MSKEKLDNINPIRDDLRPLIEEFLAYGPYQDLFMAFAKVVGYTGNDIEEAKQSLFTIKGKELVFNIKGAEELLFEYQILRQIINIEPYRSLLQAQPRAMNRVREVAKKMLEGKDITQEDLKLIFDLDSYDEEE